MLFNWLDPTFSGAFWGAFFSFCFYIFGLSLPKLIKKINLRLKRRKKLNMLYRMLLLERNSDSFFFDLIELFTFELIPEILKGDILTMGNHVQFENNLWDIVIKNKIYESRFTIKDINSLMYALDSNYKEINLNVLFDFIQYLEVRCKQEKVKLEIDKELEKGKKDLMLISSKEKE